MRCSNRRGLGFVVTLGLFGFSAIALGGAKLSFQLHPTAISDLVKLAPVSAETPWPEESAPSEPTDETDPQVQALKIAMSDLAEDYLTQSQAVGQVAEQLAKLGNELNDESEKAALSKSIEASFEILKVPLLRTAQKITRLALLVMASNKNFEPMPKEAVVRAKLGPSTIETAFYDNEQSATNEEKPLFLILISMTERDGKVQVAVIQVKGGR